MALPPPPVTFPATRPTSFNVSDWAPVRMIISVRRRPFLSGQLGRPFVRPQPSLSASAPGVMDSGFPLLLSSNGVSPPPFHLPVSVKLPVSNLDCEAILHPLNSKSSRKYFNYSPYFMRSSRYGVEIFVEKFVEMLWTFCGKLIRCSRYRMIGPKEA